MVCVGVWLRGRLLARYDADEAIARLPATQVNPAMVALAKRNLLRDRLVDEPHLDILTFEVCPT